MASKIKNTLPENIRGQLENTDRRAHANQAFLKCIKIFEKYRRRYLFDEKFNYKLGQLYDHYAIFQLKKSKQKKLRLQYLKKAEIIYQKILDTNPKSFFAWHGLSLVNDARGNHNAALRYAKQSYRYWKNLPKTKKGVLGFGNSYLLMGNIKRAEYWFKKELEVLGSNNIGAQANLLIFYNAAKKFKAAYKQAVVTERLLKEELKKPSRKRIIGNLNDKTVIFIKSQIEIAKLNGQKKPPL